MHIINASGISFQVDSTSRAAAEKQVRTLLTHINESIANLEGNPCFFSDTHLDLSVTVNEESNIGPAARPRKVYSKLPVEDAKFPIAAWRKAVAKGETLFGYYPWVAEQKAA